MDFKLFKAAMTKLINEYGIDNHFNCPDHVMAAAIIDFVICDGNGAVERAVDEADPGDMDGDAASALASAGFGTDEDYGGTDERF